MVVLSPARGVSCTVCSASSGCCPCCPGARWPGEGSGGAASGRRGSGADRRVSTGPAGGSGGPDRSPPGHPAKGTVLVPDQGLPPRLPAEPQPVRAAGRSRQEKTQEEAGRHIHLLIFLSQLCFRIYQNTLRVVTVPRGSGWRRRAGETVQGAAAPCWRASAHCRRGVCWAWRVLAGKGACRHQCEPRRREGRPAPGPPSQEVEGFGAVPPATKSQPCKRSNSASGGLRAGGLHMCPTVAAVSVFYITTQHTPQATRATVSQNGVRLTRCCVVSLPCPVVSF